MYFLFITNFTIHLRISTYNNNNNNNNNNNKYVLASLLSSLIL